MRALREKRLAQEADEPHGLCQSPQIHACLRNDRWGEERQRLQLRVVCGSGLPDLLLDAAANSIQLGFGPHDTRLCFADLTSATPDQAGGSGRPSQTLP